MQPQFCNLIGLHCTLRKIYWRKPFSFSAVAGYVRLLLCEVNIVGMVLRLTIKTFCSYAYFISLCSTEVLVLILASYPGIPRFRLMAFAFS